MASSSPQIKKSRFVKNQPLENEEMEQRLVDIKKKLLNYDLDKPRTKDERIDVTKIFKNKYEFMPLTTHPLFIVPFLLQDCFDVMLIDSDKRLA